MGIAITPDLATGPTNIFFDNGFQIGPTKTARPALSKIRSPGPTRFPGPEERTTGSSEVRFSPYQDKHEL